MLKDKQTLFFPSYKFKFHKKKNGKKFFFPLVRSVFESIDFYFSFGMIFLYLLFVAEPWITVNFRQNIPGKYRERKMFLFFRHFLLLFINIFRINFLKFKDTCGLFELSIVVNSINKYELLLFPITKCVFLWLQNK